MMVTWLCVGLAIVVVLLLFQLFSIRRALLALTDELEEKLSGDTNTLLSPAIGDRAVRALAARLNRQLRALREEQHRLAQGDRELCAAITNISHDLRTPLTAMRGYLDLLEQQTLSEPAGRYIAVIRDRTAALTALTEELFRYSIASAPTDRCKSEPVSIGDVLEESLAAFYGALTARGITPQISLPPKPVIRLLDREALRRILDNLLSNAVRYSDGDLSVSLTSAGKIRFRNTAQGLGRVAAERLFDRFYTVDNARSGTGLGLSIARLLTGRMGGSITADYRAGSLTITLSFPAQL